MVTAQGPTGLFPGATGDWDFREGSLGAGANEFCNETYIMPTQASKAKKTRNKNIPDHPGPKILCFSSVSASLVLLPLSPPQLSLLFPRPSAHLLSRVLPFTHSVPSALLSTGDAEVNQIDKKWNNHIVKFCGGSTVAPPPYHGFAFPSPSPTDNRSLKVSNGKFQE